MKKIVGALVCMYSICSICFANPIAIDEPWVRPASYVEPWYNNPVKIGIVIVLSIIAISIIVVAIKSKKKK